MGAYLSRRALLRAGLLGGLLGACAPRRLPEVAVGEKPRARVPRKIIVVGAGLSGLSAAYELKAAGHEVTVLEARLRAGGRVWTVRDFSDGLYAEAGATFLPDHHAFTMKYVKEFGLELIPSIPRHSSSVFYLRGQRIVTETEPADWPLELTAEERKLGLDGMREKYFASVLPEVGQPDEPQWPPDSLRKYDNMSLTELLRSRGASPAAITLMGLNEFDSFGGDGGGDFSALDALRDAALALPQKHVFRLRGGSDLLPRAFAERLKEHIRYGAPVTRIEQDEQGVRVVYLHRGEPVQLQADRVVCAIPFSVLRDIPVSPRWSPEKERGIRELAHTSVTHVYLQERERFWVELGLSGTGVTDLPLTIFRDATVGQPGPRGIMQAFVTGANARALDALAEPERITTVLEQFEHIFPGMKEHFEGGTSKSWDLDPWARGDYSYFKPGQVTWMMRSFGRAEGRIHFAGDQVSPWVGWMQGALWSGHRAAQEINTLG